MTDNPAPTAPAVGNRECGPNTPRHDTGLKPSEIVRQYAEAHSGPDSWFRLRLQEVADLLDEAPAPSPAIGWREVEAFVRALAQTAVPDRADHSDDDDHRVSVTVMLASIKQRARALLAKLGGAS